MRYCKRIFCWCVLVILIGLVLWAPRNPKKPAPPVDWAIDLDEPKWEQISMQSFINGLVTIFTPTNSSVTVEFRKTKAENFKINFDGVDGDIAVDPLFIRWQHGEINLNSELVTANQLNDRLISYVENARLVESRPEILVEFADHYSVQQGAELLRLLSNHTIDTISLPTHYNLAR